MGNEESSIKMLDAYTGQSYMPLSGSRSDAAQRVFEQPTIAELDSTRTANKLLKVAYHGIWSMSIPSGVNPMPRIGHAWCYSPERDSIYIAYGRGGNGDYYSDCWCLNLAEKRWYTVSKKLLSPRAGVTGLYYNGKLYMFGGYMGTEYFADLHSVDLDSGEIQTYNFPGDCPSPRAEAAMFFAGGHLTIWGGHDVHTPDSVSVLDGGTWVTAGTHPGRAAPAFCVFQSPRGGPQQTFCFGSAPSEGLLRFDASGGSFEAVDTTGTVPPAGITRGVMVPGDEFVFMIGGEAAGAHMHVFALEVRRNWWFAFHVRPDGESLTVEDGIVNKIGLFMLPREFGSSIAYRQEQRELVGVLGSRLDDPPRAYTIAIGEALGTIHFRSDMLEMFQATAYGNNLSSRM